MNYRDLQNISNLSQEILIEGANEEHNVLNRWPYTSPYLQGDIMEAEVLAQKGGVPGSVKVKPALSIPGTDIGVGPNKPVPGTFTTTTPGQREQISKGNTTIDRGLYKQSRVGTGPTADERSRYNTAKVQQGSSNRMKTEAVDLYDIILSHLLDEGYAETQEQAEVIMVNMSEDWRESIMEGMKPLPVGKMAKQAEDKAFRNHFDADGAYQYYDTNKKLKKMSEIGGEKVEKGISRGRINATKFRNRLKDSVKL